MVGSREKLFDSLADKGAALRTRIPIYRDPAALAALDLIVSNERGVLTETGGVS